MTWYFDPSGSEMDVYDHEGTQVATGVSFGGSWDGDYPIEVLAVMRDNVDNGSQPTRYNQELVMDAATGNIQQGVP